MLKTKDIKTILITGGAGFIGSHFIRFCLRKYPQAKIVNLDKLTYAGNPDNLAEASKNKNYIFVKGDICDSLLVDSLFAKYQFDWVVNFAAETHVDRSLTQANDFIRTDILGTQVLLEASNKYNPKVYLQISTDEVYGDIPKGRFAKEIDPLNPSSPYAASKAGGDMQVLAYFKTYKVPVIISRCTNNYGPNQYPEKIIPLFVTNLLENKKIPLYDGGSQIRDWLYVSDHISALDLILNNGKIGEIYNIGAGHKNEITNKKLTEVILKNLGQSENMIEEAFGLRPGHDRRYAVDTAKIRQLGWRPKIDFETGIKRTIKWYQTNQGWWQKIKSGQYLEYYKKHYNNSKCKN